MKGKDLPLRLHGCQRKLVGQAMRMLDLNDLTWYDFSERKGRRDASVGYGGRSNRNRGSTCRACDNSPQLKLGASQFDRTPNGDRP